MMRILNTFIEGPRRIGRHIGRLICPGVCGACRKPIPGDHDALCESCWTGFREQLVGDYCPTCGHNSGPYTLINDRCGRCQNRRPVVSHVVRVGPYHDVLRELILALKFRGQSHLDAFLGGLLAQAILGDPTIRSADWLVPVPLHWRRRFSRGYNQAELIAAVVSKTLKTHGVHIPVAGSLVRLRHTPAQTSLPVSRRIANLRGAFASRPGEPCRDKHICLIDDVTTTGTTLRVAGQALHKAGATRISAAVLAVAAND